MRFLVDENVGVVVAKWLREQDYEVFSVYEEARGIDDEDIIQKAFTENWILITNDKDFGEKVYREQRSHKGVILLRLENQKATNKIETLQRLLEMYPEQLSDNFIVVSETQIRFARSQFQQE
jgi:predicted nuclease of predicted toxin-antitoxin system